MAEHLEEKLMEMQDKAMPKQVDMHRMKDQNLTMAEQINEQVLEEEDAVMCK